MQGSLAIEHYLCQLSTPYRHTSHQYSNPRTATNYQECNTSSTGGANKRNCSCGPKVKDTNNKEIIPSTSKLTSEYLKHNSTWRRLRRQNRVAVSATNCGLELLRQLAASINMTIEANEHKSHHSNHRLNVVLDTESGKLLEYRHLLKTKHKEIWSNVCSKKFAGLCQGWAQNDTPFTNTIFFIAPHELPPGKKPT